MSGSHAAWVSLQMTFALFLLINRRLLFRSSSILPHDEGKGPAAFAHKKVLEPGPLGRAGQTNCTSYFIEPVQWMEAALLGVLEGQVRKRI